MGTTANRNYPYPDPGDPADMPQALQDLAEAVDLDVQALAASLSGMPLCVVTSETPQPIVFAGAAQNVSYTTVNYDNDNMANLAVTSTVIIPPTPGLYFIHGSVRCPDVSTRLDMFLRIGATNLDFSRAIHLGNAPGAPRLVVSSLVSLSGTDIVRTTIEQNESVVQYVSSARLMALQIA